MKLINKKNAGQKGSAAMEYVLVTTFAALCSMAAIGYAGFVLKEKVTKVAEKLGIDPPDWDFLSSFDDAEP